MERASERASAGDTGRRDSSASAGCGCGGEGPLRPGAPPGGAHRAAPASLQEARPPPPPQSVMAARRGRCFCTSSCGGRGAGTQPLPDVRRRHAALRQAGADPRSGWGEASLRHWRRHIPSALGLTRPRAGCEGQGRLARQSKRTWARELFVLGSK